MAEAFSWRLRVRYAECDPQGVVFNSHYLTYADLAVTELLRARIGAYQRLVDAVGRTSMSSTLTVARDGVALVEIGLRHVCITTGDWRPAPWPEWFAAALRTTAAEG